MRRGVGGEGEVAAALWEHCLKPSVNVIVGAANVRWASVLPQKPSKSQIRSLISF